MGGREKGFHNGGKGKGDWDDILDPEQTGNDRSRCTDFILTKIRVYRARHDFFKKMLYVASAYKPIPILNTPTLETVDSEVLSRFRERSLGLTLPLTSNVLL